MDLLTCSPLCILTPATAPIRTEQPVRTKLNLQLQLTGYLIVPVVLWGCETWSNGCSKMG